MAEISTVTVEISSYFHSTRAVRCLSVDCFFFQTLDDDFIGCGLKEITIGRKGDCEQFALKDEAGVQAD